MTRNIFCSTPVLIAASVMTMVSPPLAEASEILDQIENYSQEGQINGIDRVTNVNQLRDVSRTDWAYEALRSLVDRYGCIVGYPNQTYRGTQALSRYEFAAGLNACLNQIERLIASSESIVREDLDTLNRLIQEFEAELATLSGRVDNLESRTAFLEDHQFSTTTKLGGEVIFGLAGVVAGSKNNGEDDIDRVTVLGNRTRLELETSFTGEDTLFTRLSTGNFPSLADETGTFEGDLAFAEPADNDLALEVLFYNFPLGKNTQIIIGVAGLAADDIANTVSVLDGDGGSGAISAFGTRNPIYLPPGDAGLGIIHSLGDTLEISAGYLASPANDPSEGSGLFNGPYSALGQITFTPTDNLTLAATYVRSYNQSDTGTGSNVANLQSLFDSFDVFTVSDSYGLQASWAINDQIIVGGWGGFTQVESIDFLEIKQDIINWAATLAFPDLGKEGNLAGIIVGREPYVSDSSLLGEDFDFAEDDFSLHVEAFYEYKVTDNISITPGLVWITAPDSNDNNDDLIIGTIRTTFTF